MKTEPGRAEPVLIAVAWLLVAVVVARLWNAAAAGVFGSDECFHAAAAAAVLEARGLPAELPQFYSGLFYYYPPLLHGVGAAWSLAFGAGALHVLPPALFAVTLVLVAAAGVRLAPAGAAAAAALVVVSHTSFQLYAVRLYAEGLVSLLVLALTLLLVAWWRRPRPGIAIAIGLALGLALIAKFTGWLPFALVLAAAAAASRPGSSRPARPLWLAALAAFGMALPFLIRNQLLYGSALYPLGAPDLDRTLYALNRDKFSSPIGSFYAGLPGAFGPAGGLLVAAAAGSAAWRRRFGPWEAMIAFALAAMAIVPLAPYAAARHLLPFLLVAFVAAAASLFESLKRRPAARSAVLIAVLLLAAAGQATFTNPRVAADEPPWLQETFRAVGPLLQPHDQVLTFWTYDTAYYTRARATWPNPWGQRPRLRVVLEQTDPDRLIATLREFGIGWVLMPTVMRAQAFNSANFPAAFVRAANAALQDHRLEMVWRSEAVALVRVPGPPAAGAGRK